MSADNKTNLLAETLTDLKARGHGPEDVSHVQWEGGWCRWPQFAAAAARVSYNPGYGAQFVKASLKVVGAGGWWLERHEYDGSEWWEYKAVPPAPTGDGKAPTPDDLLEEYRGIRDDDVVVAGDVPAASAPAADRVVVPPEDVPHILAHFDGVAGKAQTAREVFTIGKARETISADLAPPLVFEGVAVSHEEDGGQALIYTLSDYSGSGVFVRVQSWDPAGGHKALKLLGRRLRVTVEPLPEE